MRALPVLVLVCCAALLSPAGAQAVYESVGADGVPAYSNAPARAGAARVLPATGTAQGRGAVWTAPERAQAPRRAQQPHIERLIAVLGQHYGVDPHLVRAVVEVESAFNPRARSPKGATGLMQLMPATAARYSSGDMNDPLQNIEAGVLYLRDLLRMFGGDPALALAGYNAGEGAVLRHRWRIPPYAETQQYVPRVLAAWQRNRDDPSLPRLTLRKGTPP
jgi:soluble lytic murein transglycosylase-like protein